MAHIEKWIWLPVDKYPDNQTTDLVSKDLDPKLVGESSRQHEKYTVAEFKRDYCFDCQVEEAQLRFSGDTSFRLDLNGEVLATGPVSVGGDFLFNDEPRSKHYATVMTVHPASKELNFFACVAMTPVAINEYSRGHGGFMLEAKLTLKDGRVKYITTDESWLVRRNDAFVSSDCYDQKLDTDRYVQAQETPNVWHCETAPIEPRIEECILPAGESVYTVGAGETRAIDVEFDRIYAGFAAMKVRAQGDVHVSVDCLETDEVFAHYELDFCGDDFFRGMLLRSIGIYRITVENRSGNDAEIEPYIIGTCYPVHTCAKTLTGDEELNLVMDVCRHTLRACRQMIHLDSPKHSEPLACTGDYYIESLMTSMSFGDMALAEFDIVRTAELLRMHDGRMFHTTYSLIWVLMLWDVYCITGNRALLTDCQDALYLLLNRFEGYVGENGLIETPPDYMFVDWIYIDGISMHHPPKALGQTCLCAYYYGALNAAAKIYGAIDCEADGKQCLKKAGELRDAMNRLLYDSEKKLYFDGLNTPTPEELLYFYMPRNVEKRYYMPHSNILCACFGVCDDVIGQQLIRRAVCDREWGVCQPYFKHFLLEAINRLGLQDELALKVLEDWKAPVKACSKGLVEGFIAPEPTYSFDHSHAWGGTPLYSLPKALTGIEIIEPAYRKIRLSPSLLGLEWADVEIPTPGGMIVVKMKKGREPEVTLPEGVERV